MAVLKTAGIEHALINAGGDISVIGPRGDGKPWRIAIQDPWNYQNLLDTITMTEGAVATSGNYEVYFDHEKQYHHLISPQLGSPAGGVVSASVVAPTTMMADALSTSVFILGPGKGRSFLKSIPRTGGLILTTNHRRIPVNWVKRALNNHLRT
jgi:thiamine biosynthesis lipoprotein